jgi:hypothetical protein
MSCGPKCASSARRRWLSAARHSLMARSADRRRNWGGLQPWAALRTIVGAETGGCLPQ